MENVWDASRCFKLIMVVTSFKPHINPWDHQLKLENEYRAKLQEIIKVTSNPFLKILGKKKEGWRMVFCKDREEKREKLNFKEEYAHIHSLLTDLVVHCALYLVF